MKIDKQNYYKKYFDLNSNNAKTIWNGIKFIITIKNIKYSVHRTISQGENSITNPYDIADIFDNYFSSQADTAKDNIKYSHKHFSDYLSNQCNNSIFIQPTDREEIANIISTLNMNKFSGPNSFTETFRITLLYNLKLYGLVPVKSCILLAR